MKGKELARRVRREIIELGFAGGSSYFGSSLSIVDILVAIHDVSDGRILDFARSDMCLLSKAHGALAWYALLSVHGISLADAFLEDGASLPIHTVRSDNLRIPYSGGSLGLGLGFASGCLCERRRKGSGGKAYVIMGDGEMQEGSVWEAAIFAARQGLSNLVVVVDNNGFQNTGILQQTPDPEAMTKAWEAFGWNRVTVDGDSLVQLTNALNSAEAAAAPTIILAKTIFGSGVSYMESNLDWKYRSLPRPLYEIAIAELENI